MDFIIINYYEFLVSFLIDHLDAFENQWMDYNSIWHMIYERNSHHTLSFHTIKSHYKMLCSLYGIRPIIREHLEASENETHLAFSELKDQ
jgi:hypothetical protein